MAVGWSRDGDVHEQIEATVESGVQSPTTPTGRGMMKPLEGGIVVRKAPKGASCPLRLDHGYISLLSPHPGRLC
jgi:hypothetical protein